MGFLARILKARKHLQITSTPKHTQKTMENFSENTVPADVASVAGTYRDRMLVEHKELKERHKALSDFMASDKFATLNETDQTLLRMQFTGMDAYLNALSMRLFHEDVKEFEAFSKAIGDDIAKLKGEGKSDAEVEAIISPKLEQMPTLDATKYGPLPLGALLQGGVEKANKSLV